MQSTGHAWTHSSSLVQVSVITYAMPGELQSRRQRQPGHKYWKTRGESLQPRTRSGSRRAASGRRLVKWRNSGAGLQAFHEKATPCQVRNSVFVFFLRRRSFVLPGRQPCNDQACHSLISGPRCHRSRVPSRPSAATEGSKRAVGRSEEHTSELQSLRHLV